MDDFKEMILHKCCDKNYIYDENSQLAKYGKIEQYTKTILCANCYASGCMITTYLAENEHFWGNFFCSTLLRPLRSHSTKIFFFKKH